MLDTSPNSTGNRYRRARLAILDQLIQRVLDRRPACRILDVGGTAVFWQTWGHLIDWNLVEVTCLNLPDADVPHDARIRLLTGDARAMPQIADNAFDICFSNSVIEHVGVWRDMVSMADEIRRVAPRYMVQTPNYWFPLEPHARTPFLHWLPEPLAYRVIMARRCGFWTQADTVDAALRTLQSVRLLDRRQVQALFPDAAISRERAFGLTKSLIAVRDPAPAGQGGSTGTRT